MKCPKNKREAKKFLASQSYNACLYDVNANKQVTRRLYDKIYCIGKADIFQYHRAEKFCICLW